MSFWCQVREISYKIDFVWWWCKIKKIPKSARKREKGQIKYSSCDIEALNGDRALKQWERKEEAWRAACEDWNYTANFGGSVVTWKSNLIARQIASCASAKCRAEQTSLISTEGSSAWGQILHRGHKNAERLGTAMGKKAACHAMQVASTLWLSNKLSHDALGMCLTKAGDTPDWELPLSSARKFYICLLSRQLAGEKKH